MLLLSSIGSTYIQTTNPKNKLTQYFMVKNWKINIYFSLLYF